MIKYLLIFSIAALLSLNSSAQDSLITNISGHKTISLDGKWQYIVDPYGTGFYDYRYHELNQNNTGAYWNSDIPANKTDKIEFGYSDKYTLNVPGDWNHQDAKFLYYEGIVWYKKSFHYTPATSGGRVFVYFGAVNYRADVYLNGHKLGMHLGGFTPFNFEVPKDILKPTGNFLVVKVDNQRGADEVPTLNTDWWNYGGITRSVKLVELPPAFIQDYSVQLKKGTKNRIEGWVKLNNAAPNAKVTVEIPELKIKQTFIAQNNLANVNINLKNLQLWSPETPKLYKVTISTPDESVSDKIGFRTIEATDKQVLLNGKPVFLRGICIHGEIPQEMRRAYSKADALQLLGWAKDLNCNMVRLAHYPHDESMTRMADSLGILVWSEIPVYWTINFSSDEVYQKAKRQLKEMITRDRNRASVFVWSVGNETPVNPVRTKFMSNLISTAKQLDSTRLISAALETNYLSATDAHVVNDPLGQYVDLVAFNEYLGWYGGTPAACRTATWSTPYHKPLFISETGAETLGGFHADSLTRWSEEYQEWYYKEQVAMLKRMPDNFVGLSPWILVDFRSPKRNNPTYQEGWNNKGLLDHNGKKKKAFYVLKSYYDSK